MNLDQRLRRWRNWLIKKYPLFHGCGACGHRPENPSERTGGGLKPQFSIDVVYTWVDGNDEKLAAKRAAYLPPAERRLANRHGLSLFRDNQELRYSLRSLECYAPWVRRIFIVTDDQIPDWLDTGHPKIRVVDHREIIPAACLPTFNSRVIEAYLHRIPGLNEHYIYFNDDFFLASQCTPGDFFTANGLPYIFLDWRKSRRKGYEKADSPHAYSYHNTRTYLEEHGICPAPECISAHMPFAQTKQNALEASVFYEEAVKIFARNRFRTNEEMTFSSHALCLWAYAEKRAVPCDVPYYYINFRRFDRQTYYSTLLEEQKRCSAPLFFCLNDVSSDESAQGEMCDLIGFLKKFFPSPSSFERKNGKMDCGRQ